MKPNILDAFASLNDKMAKEAEERRLSFKNNHPMTVTDYKIAITALFFNPITILALLAYLGDK